MKTKQKKMNARVDFTPMVDMMMLLVTFFMLCTTLAKPQTMEIAMPTNKADSENQSQAKAADGVTIILDENNKVFYYTGKPTDAPNTLKQVYYASNTDGVADLKSLHEALKGLNKNYKAAQELRATYETKLANATEYTLAAVQAEFDEKFDEIMAKDGTPTVLIKPIDGSTYDNLIETLDEMTLCNIGKYVIVPIDEADKATLDTWKTTNPVK